MNFIAAILKKNVYLNVYLKASFIIITGHVPSTTFSKEKEKKQN